MIFSCACVYVFRMFLAAAAARTQEICGFPGTAPVRVCPVTANPGQALQLFAADLQAELARKEIELAANAAEIHAKTLHIEKLKMQLAALRRARFGRSSEKLDRNIEQLELLISDLEEDLAAQDASARPGATEPAGPDGPTFPARPRQRRQPVRKPLPEHLPRETVVHESPCTCPG